MYSLHVMRRQSCMLVEVETPRGIVDISHLRLLNVQYLIYMEDTQYDLRGSNFIEHTNARANDAYS